jgi:acyl dehydratase
MPFSTSTIGAQTTSEQHTTDARWLMAYAGSLGDMNPLYMDTTQEIYAHPVFPVCLEWPSILATRQLAGAGGLTDNEASKGVHASHDLHIYRSIRPDETLRTHARIIDVQKIRPGAACIMQIDTVDSEDRLVCRTYQTSIYRGVGVNHDQANSGEAAPPLPSRVSDFEVDNVISIPVPAHLAHTYTECAHIWNPIHTDRAVALAAGLPDIILHGTATLALAVSALVDHQLGGDAGRVSRLGGRFAAMVLMPSDIELQIGKANRGTIGFRVLNAQGQEAISQGFLSYQ